MAYDDNEYMRALEMLDDAVAILLENEIQASDIRGLLDGALKR